ncbi:uncharacterized protein LOC115633038 [Scaptodrosophila lebanonensis]|uniref:Uncharacterized protein LOC115633038 n=1 Tax=Drosophila lebanonensis TaxID=7225 RepID=A0A6J2UGK1_DROLE|nr:uncharacterized protein LOC115633038 [Scaptodrosophila lebanonensis]
MSSSRNRERRREGATGGERGGRLDQKRSDTSTRSRNSTSQSRDRNRDSRDRDRDARNRPRSSRDVHDAEDSPYTTEGGATLLTNDFLLMLELSPLPEEAFARNTLEYRQAWLWLNKLSTLSCNTLYERRMRNMYMSHLSVCLNQKRLYGIFLQVPPIELEWVDFTETTAAQAVSRSMALAGSMMAGNMTQHQQPSMNMGMDSCYNQPQMPQQQQSNLYSGGPAMDSRASMPCGPEMMGAPSSFYLSDNFRYTGGEADSKANTNKSPDSNAEKMQPRQGRRKHQRYMLTSSSDNLTDSQIRSRSSPPKLRDTYKTRDFSKLQQTKTRESREPQHPFETRESSRARERLTTRSPSPPWNDKMLQLFGPRFPTDEEVAKRTPEERQRRCDMRYLLELVRSELRGHIGPENCFLEYEVERYRKFYEEHKHEENQFKAHMGSNENDERVFLLLNMQNDLIKLLSERD